MIGMKVMVAPVSLGLSPIMKRGAYNGTGVFAGKLDSSSPV